jgi:16S rRNA processing protein RimM
LTSRLSTRRATPSKTPAWIAVAEVARPHGVRGELRVRVYSGDPALLLRRPPIRLRASDGEITAVRIRNARPADKALLIDLEGVGDRNAAEALRGAEILVERTEFAPLDEGEFYACDIEGARAELTTGEPIGTVTGLGTYPTCDVLLIDREGNRLEVPLLPQFVESVDTDAKIVRILTLDGLA